MPVSVVLNASLEAEKPRDINMERFLGMLDHHETQELKLIKASIPGEVRHKNYLEYLETAWANHQGVVLTPDVFWYTLLCESAHIIRKDAEKYRKFFTDAPGKTTIVVLTDDPMHLPIDAIIEQLRRKVPGGLAKHFLPEFSTTDDAAREARNAAFADAVSPYYDYCTTLCGIPAVRIEGNVSDWQEIKISWMALTDVFVTAPEYCKRVRMVIDMIIAQFTEPDLDFLKDIYIHDSCGSGHTYDVAGWFTALFQNRPRDRRHYAPHVAKVEYKNRDTGRCFRSLHGVFGSALVGGFMQPLFGKVVLEEKAAPRLAER